MIMTIVYINIKIKSMILSILIVNTIFGLFSEVKIS